MNYTYLAIGIALQIGAFLTWRVSEQVLYAASWLGILLVSLPMFIASPFFLMKSGFPLPVRLGLSFWILAILFYYVLLGASDWLDVRTEVFLIPNAFRGNVTVLFDQADGAPVEMDGKKIVFRIGQNGELRTQAHERKLNNRDADRAMYERREYYWVDSSGQKTSIERPLSLDPSAIPVDRVIVADDSCYYDNDRITKITFIVGAFGELDKFRSERK